MPSPRGQVPARSIDARLLRFRNEPTSEDPLDLAEALLASGRTADAREVAERGRAGTAHPGLLTLEGRSYMKQGQLLQAQQLLLQAVRAAGEGSAGPLRWLGEVLLKRGDPARALQVLDRAQRAAPADPEIERLRQRASRFSAIATESSAPVSAAPSPEPAASRAETDAGRSAFRFDDEDEDENIPTVVKAGVATQLVDQTQDDLRTEELEEVTTGAHTRPNIDAPPSPAPSAPDPFASPAEPAFGGVPDLSADFEDSSLRSMPAAPSGDRGGERADAGPSPTAETTAAADSERGSADREADVLRMLRDRGVFDAPGGADAEWAAPQGKTGTRTGWTWGIVWGVVVLLVVGGWFGYQEWIDRKHRQAASLVGQAWEHARDGSHKDLLAAERKLRRARELYPLDLEGAEALLFVHIERALEEGAFEPGYLRPSVARAERLEVKSPLLPAAQAVLAAAETDLDAAEQAMKGALSEGGDRAEVLYVVGRLEQRLGDADATDHLTAALDAEPKMTAASLALAEAAADRGERAEALSRLEPVLERDPDHLRARLWKLYLSAPERDPARIQASLEKIDERMKEGAPTDRVLAALTAARAAQKSGDEAGAEEAVERAAEAGATAPRLLALVARAARSLGRLSLAQQTASAAVGRAPGHAEYRLLLARILLARRDGIGALRTLEPLSAEDPNVLRLSAEAALMVGTDKALAAAKEALAAAVDGAEEDADESQAGEGSASAETRALLLRVRARLGEAKEVLRDARRLARRSDAPAADMALAEAALGAFKPDMAVEALDEVIDARPDDADAHYLLGRAHRMAGRGGEAEEALERAVELEPNHTEAAMALGFLLLDRGKYEKADALYQRLAERSALTAGESTLVVGRLGRAEALVGAGKLDEAQAQLDAIADKAESLGTYRVAAGRLALARGDAEDAVATLRPVASEDEANPGVIALFGDALYEAGKVREASAQYERALEKDSTYPEALLGEMRVHVRAEKPKDALAFVEDMEEQLERRIRPPRLLAELRTLEGRAHLQRGRRNEDEARAALRAATEIDAVPGEAWFFLGEALSGENAPEARAAYERYLELEPEGPYAKRAQRAID